MGRSYGPSPSRHRAGTDPDARRAAVLTSPDRLTGTWRGGVDTPRGEMPCSALVHPGPDPTLRFPVRTPTPAGALRTGHVAAWEARRLPVTQAARALSGGIMRMALSGIPSRRR